MVQFISDIFQVLKGFVSLLFQIQIAPNVSLGSTILYALFTYAIIATIYPRR